MYIYSNRGEKRMSYLQNVKFHFDNVHKWAPLHFGPILLHQVGDLICDQDFENGLHTQAVPSL